MAGGGPGCRPVGQPVSGTEGSKGPTLSRGGLAWLLQSCNAVWTMDQACANGRACACEKGKAYEGQVVLWGGTEGGGRARSLTPKPGFSLHKGGPHGTSL